MMGYQLTTWVLPVLLCLVFHELAHGYVAYLLGDRTAYRAGRLTLDPKAHIDVIGTIALPVLLFVSGSHTLFGWAKPVPVNPVHFKHPRRGMGLVALAGPLMNIILALGVAWGARGIFALFPNGFPMADWVILNVKNLVSLSFLLAAFNLLPVLPLDGGRVVAALLPKKWAYSYQQTERYGMWILLGILFVFPLLGIDLVGAFIRLFYPLFTFLLGM